MRHWSRVAIRNWQARRTRTVGAVIAIALGVGAIVWVNCAYESFRQTALTWARGYIGNAHITVTSALSRYDQIPQRLVNRIEQIDNVEEVAPRLIQRLRAEPWARRLVEARIALPETWSRGTPYVDFHGIELGREFEMRSYKISSGRMLNEDDLYACVLESQFAREMGLVAGDSLLVWGENKAEPTRVEICGLFDRRRLAQFQKPQALMRLSPLQKMLGKFALITTVDVKLGDAQPDAVTKTGLRIRAEARRVAGNASVRTARARQAQVEQMHDQQQVMLVLLSCVVMLTAAFIVFATLSMGMAERVKQLGLMRCIGATRGQLGALVLYEVVPLGVFGVLFGVPLGLALAVFSVWIVPDYIGDFAVSYTGIAVAAVLGMATALVAAIVPAAGAMRVSPLDAVHPEARPTQTRGLIATAVIGGLTLAAQQVLVLGEAERSMDFVWWAAASIVLLFLGYAMLAPLAVRVLGGLFSPVVSAIVAVPGRLLHNQVSTTAWRAAGLGCGLMVGLALVVGILAINESITRGWQFPKQFPEGYVWSFAQMRGDAREVMEPIEGLENFTVGNSLEVIVEEKHVLNVIRSATWFMGIEPDVFFDLVRLEFVEGDQETARAKIKEGGYIVIADDFARSRNKHVGDSVRIYFGSTDARTFKVAAVVESPAIDIAATYFQLQTEYQVMAAGSVMGSDDDLARILNSRGVRYAMLNFAIPPLPDDWPPAENAAAAQALPDWCYNAAIARDTRWRRYNEDKTLAEVRNVLNARQVFSGTVRELKEAIDEQLTNATRMLTAVPGVALFVAAVGIANLMGASVMARSRELAMTRAIGATRGTMLRLVVAETLVLGLIGNALGLALGIHFAHDVVALIEKMWGFRVALALPWRFLVLSIIVTLLLTGLAGLIPARRAARANIVAALHVP